MYCKRELLEGGQTLTLARFFTRALICLVPAYYPEAENQSTDADEGPSSRVCTCATIRSAPLLTSMVFLSTQIKQSGGVREGGSTKGNLNLNIFDT